MTVVVLAVEPCASGGGLVALLLERGGQFGRLLGHFRQQLHVVELLDVVHGLC
ncbi:hypothetical protein [Streptomyces sp. F001]|uniref:hypothetical protein n=1 Tax=Streptomyces sp. F001 TaxID=1510026 RepID=UPI001F0E60C1|nr:hypothetical protein [Streptomyces sp. F001]